MSKSNDEYIRRNFKKSELVCRCGCGLMNINVGSLNKLQLLRTKLGEAIHLTSVCRCLDYNNSLPNHSPTSSHICNKDKESFAFDILAINCTYRFLIIKLALEVGFNRIGLGLDFIHIDDDPCKQPNVFFTYY